MKCVHILLLITSYTVDLEIFVAINVPYNKILKRFNVVNNLVYEITEFKCTEITVRLMRMKTHGWAHGFVSRTHETSLV